MTPTAKRLQTLDARYERLVLQSKRTEQYWGL